MRHIISTKILYAFFFFVVAVFGCDKKNNNDNTFPKCSLSAEARGNRVLAFDVLDPTETGDFDMNYDIASRQLNAEFIQLLQPWNAFENQQMGVYDGEAIGIFETLNEFAASTGARLSLIITPVDIPGRFLPAYLEGKKFDDPLVIESFNNLIDALFNDINGVVDPSRVIALSVGNEIDHYNWSANNDQISEYKSFLQAIKSKINSYGISMHFTGTLYGMTQPGNTWVDMGQAVDKVSITYYPLNSDFTVKSPNIVFADMNSIVTKFAGTELFLQEIGYPSSTTLNSSTAKQAEFFCNFFNAWDSHKDQIIHVSILRLNDVSETAAQATAVAYGIPGNTPFIEYIRTLGIRAWDGKGDDKQAFDVIKMELERRDW
ncbi:MAG: hypothetical protein ACFCUM_09935 [Bacteroidales bacterium]